MRKTIVVTLCVCTILMLSGCVQNNPPEKDTKAPTNLQITINDGNNYTNKTEVSLALSAKDDSDIMKGKMCFSNEGANWTTWEPFVNSRKYNVNVSHGEKRIFFKVKDKAGNVADPVNDNITFDDNPPKVIETYPSDKATGVPLTTRSITMTFSERMDTSKGPGDPVKLKAGINEEGIEKTMWKTDRQIELVLTGNRPANTTYTVEFNNNEGQIMDLAGNLAQKKTWSFSTRLGAKVTSHSPIGKDVDVAQNIVMSFDRPMNKTSTERAINIKRTPEVWSGPVYTVTWNGNEMTLHFTEYLLFSTLYTVTLCGNYQECGEFATDSEGGNLDKTLKWEFTTRKSKTELVSHVLYHKTGDPNTYVHLLLKNNEKFNVTYLYAGLELLDSSNNVVSTKNINVGGQDRGNIFTAGERVGYMVTIGDVNGVIKSVRISVGSDPTRSEHGTHDAPYKGLVAQQVTGPKKCPNNSNGNCLEGRVKNNGNETIAYVDVWVAYFDAQNNFVAALGNETQPNDVGVGMETKFWVTLWDNNCDISKIDHCEIVIKGK